MRIAVFGAGAVGGYFGARFAQAGIPVAFIARGEHLKAIRKSGLHVSSIHGDFHLHPVTASDDPAEIGPVDAVLVCVKTWQVPEAAESMRPMVGPDTMVIPLLNGVDAADQLGAVLGKEHVLGGFCLISSRLEGPGRIRHALRDPYLAFGELDERPSARADRLKRAFSKAKGITVEIPEDILAGIWQKFLSVASFGGVGAVTRAPIGVIRTVPETRAMLIRAMEEIVQVARARRIRIPEDSVEKRLSDLDRLAPGGMTSMQSDILSGRPSELEAQSGAVVRLGKDLGAAVPVHAFIYHSLLPQEMKARGKVQFGEAH